MRQLLQNLPLARRPHHKHLPSVALLLVPRPHPRLEALDSLPRPLPGDLQHLLPMRRLQRIRHLEALVYLEQRFLRGALLQLLQLLPLRLVALHHSPRNPLALRLRLPRLLNRVHLLPPRPLNSQVHLVEPPAQLPRLVFLAPQVNKAFLVLNP